METPLRTALLVGSSVLVGVLSYRKLLRLSGRGRARAGLGSALLAALAVAGVAIWFSNSETGPERKNVLRGAAARQDSVVGVRFQTKYFGLEGRRTFGQIRALSNQAPVETPVRELLMEVLPYGEHVKQNWTMHRIIASFDDKQEEVNQWRVRTADEGNARWSPLTFANIRSWKEAWRAIQENQAETIVRGDFTINNLPQELTGLQIRNLRQAAYLANNNPSVLMYRDAIQETRIPFLQLEEYLELRTQRFELRIEKPNRGPFQFAPTEYEDEFALRRALRSGDWRFKVKLGNDWILVDNDFIEWIEDLDFAARALVNGADQRDLGVLLQRCNEHRDGRRYPARADYLLQTNGDGLFMPSAAIMRYEQRRSVKFHLSYTFIPGLCFHGVTWRSKKCLQGWNEQRSFRLHGLWEVSKERDFSRDNSRDLRRENLDEFYLNDGRFEDIRRDMEGITPIITQHDVSHLVYQYSKHGQYLQMYNELRDFENYSRRVITLEDEFHDRAQRFSEQLEEAVRNTDADDRVILCGRMRQIIRNAFGAACDVNVRNNPRSLTDRPTILTEVKCCLNRDFAPIDCLGPEGRLVRLPEYIYIPSMQLAFTGMYYGENMD